MTLKLRRKVIRAAITRVINRLKRGWTRKASARTASRARCTSDDPKAVCWCASGAINVTVRDSVARATIRYAVSEIIRSKEIIKDYMPISTLVEYNDHVAKNRDDVIDIFEQVYDLTGDNNYLKDLVRIFG